MKHRCTICAYVYDDETEGTAFNDLPDDWACPVCNAGKDAFESVDQTGLCGVALCVNGCIMVIRNPFELLPDDWKCPKCGAPKRDFEKIT